MWCIWGLVVLVYVALRIYVARLDRDEDDTILLDDAFAHERAAQEAIIAKVKKIQPVQRIALIALVAMSLLVIGYYIWDSENSSNRCDETMASCRLEGIVRKDPIRFIAVRPGPEIRDPLTATRMAQTVHPPSLSTSIEQSSYATSDSGPRGRLGLAWKGFGERRAGTLPGFVHRRKQIFDATFDSEVHLSFRPSPRGLYPRLRNGTVRDKGKHFELRERSWPRQPPNRRKKP